MAHEHYLKVTGHKIYIDARKFVQGGINHDTITIFIDEEWDGCDRILMTAEAGEQTHVVQVEPGQPVEVPSGLLEATGTIRFSLTGYVGDEARITTEAMGEFTAGLVVASGTVSGGGAPSDAAPDLWLQLMQQVDEATSALDKTTEAARGYADSASQSATQASESASAASSSASRAKTAETNAKASETASKSSQDAAKASETAAAKSASDAAASAKGISDSVSAAAKSAEDAQAAATTAQGHAETAATKASEASKSATDAQSAKTAAETAKTAAEAAKTAAESARTASETARNAAKNAASTAQTQAQSAQSSAQDAENAAQSASEAATSATGAASSATGAASSAADAASSAQQAAQGAISILGNVPKKTVTDLVAHGEDAFPQKPREVRIKGKTWVNRWPVIEGTQDGLTIATDETGLITVSGTATATGHIRTKVSGLAENKNVSAVKSGGTVLVSLQAWNAGSYVRDVMTVNTSASTANTGTGFDTIYARINYTIGETYNTSFRVMLVDGTEAPDCFTPPASIASVETGKLVTTGKNLLTEDVVPLGTGGTSVSVAGSYPNYTLTGTVSMLSNYALNVPDLPIGSYMLSGAPDGSQFVIQKEDGSAYANGKSVKFTLDGKAFKYFLIQFSPDSSFDHTPFNPQIELGSTATSYEPPTVTQTPLPEVELRSLPNGTCDELIVKSDGTANVERKTHSYTATGEEDVIYGNTQARFDTGIPFTSVSGSSVNIFCDKLPTVTSPSGITGCAFSELNGNAVIYFNVVGETTDVDTSKAWLASNTPTFVFARNKTTEPQSPVTLPTLPAPTFNAYSDADIPSDTSVEYARDINIVLSNLEAVQTALLGGE